MAGIAFAPQHLSRPNSQGQRDADGAATWRVFGSCTNTQMKMKMKAGNMFQQRAASIAEARQEDKEAGMWAWERD